MILIWTLFGHNMTPCLINPSKQYICTVLMQKQILAPWRATFDANLRVGEAETRQAHHAAETSAHNKESHEWLNGIRQLFIV